MTSITVPNHASVGRKPGRVLAALLVTAAAAGAAAFPHASEAATKTCSPPKYPGVGYFTSLKVTGAGCATGNKVVKAYYKCRIKKGKAGRCTSKIAGGYRCTETRRSIPTELNARVTCKKGRVTVVHTYQQDL